MAANNKRARKRRKTRDPLHPKRPVTGFFSFCAASRKSARMEHPDANVATLARVLGTQWNEMDAASREPYMENSATDKLRYLREMALYTPPPPPVKRVRSAYLFYCMSERVNLVALYPTESVPDIGRRLGRGWRELGECDKLQYVEQSVADKARYNAAVAADGGI